MRPDYGRWEADQGRWPLCDRADGRGIEADRVRRAAGPGLRDPKRLDKHGRRAHSQALRRCP